MMNKEKWQEIRKEWGYSRRKIIFILVYHVYLRNFKWYLFHLCYKLIKYNHKHIWGENMRCLICRKTKANIDWERHKNEE